MYGIKVTQVGTMMKREPRAAATAAHVKTKKVLQNRETGPTSHDSVGEERVG